MTLSSLDHLTELWLQVLIEGKSPFKEATVKEKEEMYAVGFALYEKQKYNEASFFFRALATIDPSNIRFWKALGASLQMTNDLEGALNCYLATIYLIGDNQRDSILYIHAADCYFALQRKDEGLQALKMAEMGNLKDKDEKIQEHISFMRTLWDN